MDKFKCQYCGKTQNTDGFCKHCDIGMVQPINGPDFIRGARYRCDNCGHYFKINHGICPRCGNGKINVEYKNHRKLERKAKLKPLLLIILALVLYKPVSSIITEQLQGYDGTGYIVMSNPLNSRAYYIELAQKTIELNPTSYQRLLNELINSGVSDENARYGLDNSNVDWNRQALRAVEYYKKQADYGDILIEKYLVDQELFTEDQAKAGLELYYQENNLNRSKVLDFYGTTTVRYIDTDINMLDNGNYEIKSRFSISSTEKCVIEFGVCYFNDYKEEIEFSYDDIKTKIEIGESIATITSTVPYQTWKTPEYLVMAKGDYFNRDDMIEINIVK